MDMNGTATVSTHAQTEMFRTNPCKRAFRQGCAATIKKIHVCGFRNFGSCDWGVNDHRVPGIVFCLAYNLVK